MTSMGALRRLRVLLGEKKAGHSGTLDPGATGVLPVCLGQATRLAEYYTRQPKSYRAEATFGLTTDTQDAEGTVLRRTAPDLRPEAVQEALFSFLGKIKQLPPMYSAVHHNGQRLYDLARRGVVAERAERETEILAIRWLDWTPAQYPRAVFTVTCSSGTYIRTLCHDLGERLGCGAHMSALCRTQAGPFQLEQSVSLAEIAARLAAGDRSFILPPGWGLPLPVLELPPERAAAFRHGLLSALARIGGAAAQPGLCAVYQAGTFLGIGRVEAEVLRPVKVLSAGAGADAGGGTMVQGG